MNHEAQVAQARKLLAYVQSRTTAMAPEVYRNAVREYVCPRQLAQERELFFSRCPSMVGLSCPLAPPRGTKDATMPETDRRDQGVAVGTAFKHGFNLLTRQQIYGTIP